MKPKKSLIALFIVFLIFIPPLSVLPTTSKTSCIEPIILKGFHCVGSLPPNCEVLITIFIPLKNENLVYYYACATSNPSSPLYHHFLTKKEVKKLFYPVKEFNFTLSYLKDHGFRVIMCALDSVIVAEGSAYQVEKYLGLNYSVFTNGSVYYYTAYGKPKLPFYIYSSNFTAIFFSHPTFLLTQNLLKQMAQTSRNLTEPFVGYNPIVMQRVYNMTWLYNKGYEGQNYTIGILDFCGDPNIVEQLQYFDKIHDLPNPNLTIIPIGPYNPNKGILNGWAYEISLDVEISHVMAPKANIILYIGNCSFDLPSIIAYIDQQDKVDVLSQSFGIPEYYILCNSPTFLYNFIILGNLYYALGSAEGITFLAASGDGGGSGYSFGPLGNIPFPSDSPFVTAVGGTTTYVDFPNGSYQTAWSSYGFIPGFTNDGGSTGGVSAIMPKPWYQWCLKNPPTFPNGRMTPDIAANANIYPGIYIIGTSYCCLLIGGTSEASPLTAGLLVVEMQFVHHKIGLLNPLLYYVATHYYGEAIEPITFGYNIPWVANYGYNLVTGWGTINAGEFASQLEKINNASLVQVIEVNVTNSSGLTPREFYPGQTMYIWANASNQSSNMYAVLETVAGNVSFVKMFYNSTVKLWEGEVVIPDNSSGVTYVIVYGDGKIGFTLTFTGYIVEIERQCFFSLRTSCATTYAAYIYNIYGEIVNVTPTLNISVYSYNITNNEYTKIGTFTFNMTRGVICRIIICKCGVIIKSVPVTYYKGNVTLPVGVYLMKPDEFYGYHIGIRSDLIQGFWLILSHVVSMPGAVAPGQTIYIDGVPSDFCANVTAELVNPQGVVVSKVSLTPTIVGIFVTWMSFLKVPSNATPGLYYVLLFSTLSTPKGNVEVGYFYGEIYVSQSPATVSAKICKYVFEGSNVTIYANITYSNGTEVKYGIFSAVVYPIIYQRQATTIELDYSFNIPLYYNSTLNLWVGKFTVPSSESEGNLTYLGTQYYGGPLGILIFGNAYDGYPTNVTYTDQDIIYVLPYTKICNQVLTSVQPFNVYLHNDLLKFNGITITDSILDNVTICGDLTIAYSNLTNVNVKGNVTLISSNAENIKVINGSIRLINSKVDGINLNHSTLINEDSSLCNITPSLPKVYIVTPSQFSNVTGEVTISSTVMGTCIKGVTICINGIPLCQIESIYNLSVKEVTQNGAKGCTIYNYSFNSEKLPDGTYIIKLIVEQYDGLNVTKSVVINVYNKLAEIEQKTSSICSNVSSEISTIVHNLSCDSSKINSENNRISSMSTDYTALIVVAIVLALISLVLTIRKK
jgi:subtilase family serine protease